MKKHTAKLLLTKPATEARAHVFAVLFFVFFAGCVSTGKSVVPGEGGRIVTGKIISGKTGSAVSFEDFIDDLLGARVVYIGERHTNRIHHDNQLAIIARLSERSPDFAVGMEMFDRSYQSVLDDWTAGKLDQKAFLKKCHWYANWRIDYELYEGILKFVKENRIKLVGLNIPFHIPPKIAVGGIANLLPDEKKWLPKTINTENTDHRNYLEKIFKMHNIKGRDSFEDFYTTQCVWEEIMAESVANHLGSGKMAVIAGNGHIVNRYGIPDRAFARTNAPFRTVLQAGSADEYKIGTADFIVITKRQ